MTERDPQRAAREAAAAFIQSASDGARAAGPESSVPFGAPAPAAAAEGYGAVGAARARGSRRGRNGALVALIGLLICALVAAGIVASLFISGFFTQTPMASTQRVVLSDERVIAAFENVTMDAPDISQYAYVAQDGLIGPKFSDIVLNEPVELGVPGGTVVECTATATATFKNRGIEITVPVTLPFEYSEAGETWVPGELTRGEGTATPSASASATDILANLNDILMAYDATYGEAMANADIVKTSSDLSIDGGPITVSLSKHAVEKTDDKSVSEQRSATVQLGVAWSSTEGWLVTVGNASQIDTKKEETPIATLPKTDDKEKTRKPDKEPTVDERAATEPDVLGAVNFGDSVSLPGTLIAVEGIDDLARSNNYNDSSKTANADGRVQLVLKLHRPMEVTVNGTSYRLNTVAVAVNGVDAASLVGREAEVSGPLEESFTTSWSPLGIKALEIHMDE